MQIKTTMKYNSSTLRVVIIKRTRNSNYLQGYKERETLGTNGNFNQFSHYGNSYASFLKLKELLYDQEIQLLGIYPKEIKTGY